VGDDARMINPGLAVWNAWQALKFLFIGPAILALLLVINMMTSFGDWWVQWPALGIGIAWLICLWRVLKVALIAGGVATLIKRFAR
jgi:hypothetical protein